jgi:hypothetical protein
LLEGEGCCRLSIDEEIFARWGEHGGDDPEREYRTTFAEALGALDQRLAALSREGRDVIRERMLDDLLTRWEPPAGEREMIIEPPATTSKAYGRCRRSWSRPPS